VQNTKNKQQESIKDFLYIFTHELKTPLNLIGNFAQVMRRRVDRDKFDKEKFINYLTSIEKNSDKMLHIINTLLTVGRLEKGYNLNKSEKIDLVKIINQEIFDFSTLLKDKNIDIEFNHNTPSVVFNSDLYNLQGLITNILSNCVKYTKDKIKITLNDDGKNIILLFEDNGDGIKDKTGVFDMFNMQNNSNVKNSSGIGLYYVKLVCESLHIKYSIEDSNLGGAMFKFVITTYVSGGGRKIDMHNRYFGLQV